MMMMPAAAMSLLIFGKEGILWECQRRKIGRRRNGSSSDNNNSHSSKRRSVGIFMTIQSAQQLPIKIFPQKSTTHTERSETKQNRRQPKEKKGFCVRLINCFAHVFRAKCSPERINPTTGQTKVSYSATQTVGRPVFASSSGSGSQGQRQPSQRTNHRIDQT